jgi:dipeptidyl aminopeptidase/acylaminoacyl peptidase
MKKRKIVLIVILGILIFLLIPVIINDRTQTYIEGTKLVEMEYTEVFYKNEIDNIDLAGLLMLPKGNGPFPTVVIVSGSGPSFRDNWWTLTVVKHLNENGIAVVVPDKRGCDKSKGNWIGADFDQLANDVISAVNFVQNQNTFEYSSIGVLGISQGGWIAPLSATKSKDISFVVSLSGPTVTAYEQLLHEETSNISGYTYPFIAKWIAPITTKRLQDMEHLKAYANFDPIPHLKKVDVPTFFAFGGGDKLVPVENCIKRLEENNLTSFSIKTYPDGGHALIDIESKAFSKSCLNDLVTFIKDIER